MRADSELCVCTCMRCVCLFVRVCGRACVHAFARMCVWQHTYNKQACSACKHTTKLVLGQCKAVVCHSSTRHLKSSSGLMHHRGKAMACDHPHCNKLPSSGFNVAHNGTQPLLGIHITAGSNTGLGAQWNHVQLPCHLPPGCSSCHRSCPHQQHC